MVTNFYLHCSMCDALTRSEYWPFRLYGYGTGSQELVAECPACAFNHATPPKLYQVEQGIVQAMLDALPRM